MTLLETTVGQELARRLDARRSELAGVLTNLHYERRPELIERYGPIGRERCLQDAAYHLSYLAEALAAGAPDLFADYVAWAKVMLEGRGIPASDLSFNLETLRDVLRRELPAGQANLAAGYVEDGLARLPGLPSEPPSAMPELPEDGPLGRLAADYLQALLRGERHVASRLVLDAVESGIGVKDVYLHVFQRSQHEIGRLWQMNRLSVAQEHYCTAATQLIMSQLYPYIFNTRRNGRVLVATCVAGDLHEIGVRMVSDFFAAEGWETFYLGANTPNASLIQTLRDREADVLAVSATMAFHLRAVSDLIAAVRASDVGERVRILVGGYPFNIVSDLWRLVGADAVARSAKESVAVAEHLVEERERSGHARIYGEPVRTAGFEDTALQLGEQEERDDLHYDELSRLNNELTTIQRELAKSNVQLGSLNRQKNEFLGIAAHDLRNPLEVILTYSQFLLDEAAESLRPEHLEFVRTIRSSSEFMLRLVEDLLDVTRIEAGTLELDMAAVDLREVVERNVALNRVLAGKKGTRIELRCDGIEPLVLDEAKIEQVLNNLIGNAIKYSPPGSTVEVRVADGPEAAEISVRDQGEGLAAEEIERLFRPFQRGRTRSTAGEKSTGLGLAIVKRIVEGHHGEVRVESTAGGGAVFRVLLPKAAAPARVEAAR